MKQLIHTPKARAQVALFCLLSAALFAASFAMASAPDTDGAADAPLQVVVSILPQAWFVQAVGGENVQVQVLVGPGHSPATFEPTVKQLAGLQAADLFITAGVPFELGLMPKIAGMRNGPRLCGPEAQRGHHDHDGDHHGHHHAEGELDPHFWLDPEAAWQHLELIAAQLSALRPTLAPEFQDNLARTRTVFDALRATLDRELQPHAGQAFLVFHPSFGHLARRYGLQQIAVEDGGHEPGPRQLAAIIDRARETGARAIIVQPQFSRKSAQVVANSAGLDMVELDPLGPDYPTNMEHIARTLARHLGPAEGGGHE